MSQQISNKVLVSLGVLSALLAGCKSGEATQASSSGTASPSTTAAAGTSTTATTSAFQSKATAGVPISPADDPNALKNLIASAEVRPRKDPFSLTGAEKNYDLNQLAERLSNEGGITNLMYEIPQEKDSDIIPEELQPYRRLCGVIIGDSVLAILVTPGQEEGKILKPGDVLPGTAYRVVSIDEDKLVLERSDGHRPKRVVVRLEQAPAGTLGQQAGVGAGAGVGGGPAGRPGTGAGAGSGGND